MRSSIFSSILLGLTPLLAQGAPPSTEPKLLLTPSDLVETADYATLHSPSSGTRLNCGQPFDIIFSDPGTSASEARFSLANYTGVYRLGNFDLKTGQVKQTVILPHWVAEGTYDFVVSENDSPWGSDDFNMDVVICTIFVGRPRENQIHFTPFRNQEEFNENGKIVNSLLHKREPHPPKFLSPTSNEAIAIGAQFQIRFLDGELDPSVDSARFVLKPLASNTGHRESHLVGPSASADGTYKFNGLSIEVNVTVSDTVTPGAYMLVAQEVDPQSPQSFHDVASTSVQITSNRAQITSNRAQDLNETTDQETRQANQNPLVTRSGLPSSVSLRKRATTAFRTPTKNQKIITGHHLNITLVNVLEDSGKVRFLLEPIQTKPKQKQLVLFGRYAEANEIFHYENSIVNARVFFPEGIANGTYNLVAQDYSSSQTSKDLASVQIQVQQIRPITRLARKDTLPSLLDKPSQPREYPVSSTLSESQLQPRSLHSVKACDLNSAEMKSLQRRKCRESPTMIKPSSGQEVPIGSKFLCEVQERSATTETINFHLRDFSGEDHYLGSAKFVKGIAKLVATCPTNVQFDSYSVVARQNSLKKPATFLDVISTSIVISHQPTMMSRSSLSPIIRRSTIFSKARLTQPIYDQYIPAGKLFDCQLQNVMVSENVRFMLRTHDGDTGHAVGGGVAKGNMARMKCQIPSSVVPGTYDLVAQKSPNANPDNFSDVDHVTITLANPRGFGPDIGSEEPQKIVQRSLETVQSQTLMNSIDAPQVSILLEPVYYQTIVQGQGFEAKLKNNTSPPSTKLRFLLEPMTNSSDNKQYILGTSTNGEAVHETLRCPDHIQSGTYLFVVQANDTDDLDSFVDSSSTPIFVKDRFSSHSDSSPNNSTSTGNFTSTGNSTSATIDGGVYQPEEQQPTTRDAGVSKDPTDAPSRLTTMGPTPDPNIPPDSQNSSMSSTGGPQSIDRSSTPLGPGYARSNNNIFASAASRSAYQRHHPVSFWPFGSPSPHLCYHHLSLPEIALFLLKLASFHFLPIVGSLLLPGILVQF